MGIRLGTAGKGLALGCAMGLAACAHRPPVDAAAVPRPPAAGEVGYEILRDPAAPRPELPEGYQIAPPRLLPGSGQLPEYPPRPLSARHGAAVTLVRIVVSAEGSVRSVQPSPLGPSSGGAYESDFEGAVREAVSGWEFIPATVSRLEPGPDGDGDGRADFTYRVDSETIPYYIDLRFSFEIKEGRGEVRVDSPPLRPEN